MVTGPHVDGGSQGHSPQGRGQQLLLHGPGGGGGGGYAQSQPALSSSLHSLQTWRLRAAAPEVGRR